MVVSVKLLKHASVQTAQHMLLRELAKTLVCINFLVLKISTYYCARPLDTTSFSPSSSANFSFADTIRYLNISFSLMEMCVCVYIYIYIYIYRTSLTLWLHPLKHSS